MCGGTIHDTTEYVTPQGLSPRVRGNRVTAFSDPDTTRSIPACAGEPQDMGAGAWTLKVYPRVCGGTYIRQSPRKRRLGLSPRVRGNRHAGATRTGRFGSIPACAGEPFQGQRQLRIPKVYPRVCGGTVRIMGLIVFAHGLSPRVRGNPQGSAHLKKACRSIPACAGEPLAAPSLWLASRVYPRVCGGTNCP